MRWEFRIHGFGDNWPVTGATLGPFYLWNQPEIGAWINTSIGPWDLVANNGTYIKGCCAGRSDLLGRVQRDAAHRQYTFELCDTTGGQCSSSSSPINTFGPTSWAGMPISLGAAGTQFAFLRWSRGVVPVGTVIPLVASGDLADWEFEGNLRDSSVNGLDMSGGNSSYPTTPSYAPACSSGAAQTFRAGEPAVLDGSGSQALDGGTLTFEWQSIPSLPGTPTQNLIWSSTSVAKPVIQGLVSGPANFQLTVTQSDGRKAVCTVHHGAVATDQNGIIIFGNSAADIILGPMTRMGINAWPFGDRLQTQWATRFGNAQNTVAPSGVSFVRNWDTTLAGTIDIVNGSTAVTGSGTSFGAALCGGASSCRPGTQYILIWYNVPNANPPVTGRAYLAVASVESETRLTLASPWLLTPSQTSINYSTWPFQDGNYWLGGSASNNYYDNVMAYYATYYRTGIDTYLGWARWLADAWWTVPGVDGYRGCNGLGNGVCLAPRIRGTAGMFLRAVDQDAIAGSPGSSPMWPFLRSLIDKSVLPHLAQVNYPVGGISDLREESYEVAEVALCANFDPDTAHQLTCLAALQNTIKNRWAPQQQPDGSWQGVFCNQKCNYGAPDEGGTLTMTNGSANITLNGGTWSTANFCNAGTTGQLFTFGNSLNHTTWDSQVYTATFVDSTHATISPQYTGPTTRGRFFGLSCGGGTNDWVGFITQPFMLGITANAFRLSYHALQFAGTHPPFDTATATQAKGFVADIGNWISTIGVMPASRGLKYGVGASCSWPNPTNPYCVGGTEPQVRELSPEAFSACSGAYSFFPTAGLLNNCDRLYAANMAKLPSDLYYDGIYAEDMDPETGYFWNTYNGKWFGFYFGYGRGHSWPAARLGPVQPPDLRDFAISDLALGNLAAFVIVTEPSGARRTYICEQSCTVKYDARQGRHWMQAYLLLPIGNWGFIVFPPLPAKLIP
jgi:hypothetical protein